MTTAPLQPRPPKLSICITTFNRGHLIGGTIENVLGQLTDECELVILDGASTDDTERVVLEYSRRSERLRYIRQDTNNGFDQDLDRLVELARGEYCWLTGDDDLLKPGAVAAVLAALRRDWSLIVVNVEARNFDMSMVLQRRWLTFDSDRVYGPEEMERLFVEAGVVLKYFGCVIIKREVWLARERQLYYGTWFTYLAVVFQSPLPGNALVIAEPLVSYRKGNAHSYSPRLSEIWFATLPTLIGSLTTVSDAAKIGFWKQADQWTVFPELLRWRAFGLYSLTEYKRWIRPRLRSIHQRFAPAVVALLPGILVNALFIFFHSVTRSRRGAWQPEMEIESLRESRFHIRNWQLFRRHP